jgi:hypothetical protein
MFALKPASVFGKCVPPFFHRDNDNDFVRIGSYENFPKPEYIDDSSNISIMEIRTKARRLQMEKGLDMIVIDYLQHGRPWKVQR